jgi:uncharacterized membrane protein YqgA involved in biofilm formation
MDILQSFSGVLVNTLTAIIGGTVGLLLKKQIPEKLTSAVMTAIGLCTIAIGIGGIIKGENQLVMIISLVLGTIVGTLVDLDSKLSRLGDKLQKKKTDAHGSTFSQGFVTASLLFCVGAMTLVGSMNAGISGDNEMLYTKSLLDLISATMLSASLGIGVLCSAAFVLVFQGAIALLGSYIQPILTDYSIAMISTVGSLLIIALSLNMLGITKFKVMNFMPAVFLPLIFCLI